LDGPLPKLCPAVVLSHQDGHHSAVALLLKAALIQVSDYRLLGACGYRAQFAKFVNPVSPGPAPDINLNMYIINVIADDESKIGLYEI
jgi:hypothetical protein